MDDLTPRRNRGITAYLLVAAILIFLAAFMLPRLNQKEPEYTYSEIMQHFDDLEVTAYTLDLGSGELKMKLKGGEELEYEVPYVAMTITRRIPKSRSIRIITRSQIIRGSSLISRLLSSLSWALCCLSS